MPKFELTKSEKLARLKKRRETASRLYDRNMRIALGHSQTINNIDRQINKLQE